MVAQDDLTRFINQEKLVIERLGLCAKDLNINERAQLAKYIEDIDCAIFNESVLLFNPDKQDVTPLNLMEYTQNLIAQCEIIYDMSITMAPCWCFDRIATFFSDMEKLLNYGDSEFKEHFVVVLRLVTDAQEQLDLCSIADLFLGEIPSLLRAFMQSQKGISNNQSARAQKK